MQMKPTDQSLLVDLDNTVYDMTQSWEKDVQKVYPGLKCDYHPITEKLIKKSTLKGCASLRRIYDTCFYLDEPAFGSAVDTVRELQAEGRDVWFVTLTIGTYHATLSEFEKRTYLLRDFGSMGQKVIFSGRKWEVPGRFLIDDHPMLLFDQEKGSWEGITVTQVYNIENRCEKWIETGNFGKLKEFID